MFNGGLDDLNAARRAHGLEPVDVGPRPADPPERILVLTSRAFEYPGYAPPANVHVTGPRLDDPAWAGTRAPPPGDEPLVLVGLSSTFMRQESLLGRIAAALGELPVRGLITTGPSVEPDTVAAPANVTVVRSAPHSEVLRQAALTVTHAGHGTVIKALAAGVPVVALPMGRDQLDNAARVVYHRAGVRLKPSAKPGAIAAAVREVLGDASYAAGAQRLAAAIAEELREDRAVRELEELAVGPKRLEALAAGARARGAPRARAPSRRGGPSDSRPP